MRNDLMTLKEVCKETGVTRKIVQTYENYGLVKATKRISMVTCYMMMLQ